ncbi:hypothetical protein [Pseudochryseolinea flava]|uniref:Uncharacterized protein n=1 Tax=Pseudochryseolinea flava TaxID=2059302 RepID=A0A364Y5C4_9BACT|nr:hypothetical protein [Pseudochryseolinea flava]RAW02198.1 hypothetical protein DQQ10_06560 [Pseudochryseolinea flava]
MVKIGKPYKIDPERAKRYAAHYNILPERTLVVPTKILGEEASCEIHWEDEGGNAHVLKGKIFVTENLVPINPMAEFMIYELWRRNYAVAKE